MVHFALLERAWRGEPSFSRGHDDISLIGSASTHEGSPSLVLERLRALIDDVLSTYARYGFTPKRKLHVFLALNEGEFKPSFGGPALFSHSGQLDINVRGERRARPVDRTTSFLVIPHDEAGGPLLNRFVIAHELAHAVVQTPDVLLDEATSDWLASVATGETTLRNLPVRRYGDRVTSLKIVRDTARPAITKATELVPRLDRSHSNSTLLSHLLRELALRHGVSAVMDLVGHLERQQARMLAVADARDRAELTALLPSVLHIEFVDLNARDLGTLVRDSVFTIATLTAEWARSTGVDLGDALDRRDMLIR